MKRVIILGLAVAMLLGVLSECKIPAGPVASPLAPPTWIIGEWDNGTGMLTWEFSIDNAVHSSNGMIVLDLKEMAKQTGVTVSDSCTSTSYCATMTDGVYTQTYNFDKLTSVTVDYTVTTNGIPSGPIELTKQ
jgi:hypothetical protein